MNFCYIIYSKDYNKYYTGVSHEDVETRIQNHNNKNYDNAYTSFTNDWKAYLCIECKSFKQALKIEKHIKLMKSTFYIENLKKYPEMIEKLMAKYDH